MRLMNSIVTGMVSRWCITVGYIVACLLDLRLLASSAWIEIRRGQRQAHTYNTAFNAAVGPQLASLTSTFDS